MRIVDLWPVMSTHIPGDRVALNIRIESPTRIDCRAKLSVWHLSEKIFECEKSLAIDSGCHEYQVMFAAPADAPRGYGVEINLDDGEGKHPSAASTAVDVLNHWTERPRYGFLTDFVPNRSDIQETITSLSKFHINALQFYDWQYRHDHLIPPEDIYTDPLDRRLSLDTVKEFIDAAHNKGMAAMAYTVVYASSMEFWNQHRDWGLYDAESKPITFEGFLSLMDPSPYSLWVDHLLDECEKVLAETSFDGLHVDQYGEPKEGFNARGDVVDIPASFNYFIWLSKKRLPEATITFNAVGNWPIDHLASAPQDFLYIEVWPPAAKYLDLLNIIKGARGKSDNKPVAVALYLPAEWESNIRLVDALVFSAGGCRIEIGEEERLLTDPYFPNYQPIPLAFIRTLRRYYNFAVRYGDLIGPQAEDADDVRIELPEGIWGIVRRFDHNLVISLVNFKGLEELCWDELHPVPLPMEEFNLLVSQEDKVQEVYWSSPDNDSQALTPLKWRHDATNLVINVPGLAYWSLLVIELI